MPKLSDINLDDLNKYSYEEGKKTASNYRIGSEMPQDKGKPMADYLKGMMALYDNMKQIVIDNPDLLEETTDEYAPDESAAEFVKHLEDLSFDPQKVTPKTANTAWQLDGKRVCTGIGKMASRGILSEAMANPKKAGLDTVDKQAAFYLKVVEPMMKDDGKLLKSVLKEYGDYDKVEPQFQSKERKKFDAVYNYEKKIIDQALGKNKELQDKIAALRINKFELDRISDQMGNDASNKQPEIQNKEESVIEDDNLIPLPKINAPNRQKAVRSRREQLKDMVYSARNVDKPSFEKGKELFGSVKILAFGPESTEHSLVNKAVSEYENYINNFNKEQADEKKDDLEEMWAEKVCRLENIMKQANTYADLKTKDGLPNTPAGKDRLAGSFAIHDGAMKELDKVKNEILKDGKYKSLNEFKDSAAYMETATAYFTGKLGEIKEYKNNDPIMYMEQKSQFAQLMAYKIKLEPEKYVPLPQLYGDMNASQIADKLMHSQTFAGQYDKAVSQYGNGQQMLLWGADVMQRCQGGLIMENKDNFLDGIKDSIKANKELNNTIHKIEEASEKLNKLNQNKKGTGMSAKK